MEKNAICNILIGGGYSVKEGIELGLWKVLYNYKKMCRIFSINFAYKLMPYEPDYLVWMDENVYLDNREEINKLKCKKICADLPVYKSIKIKQDIKRVRTSRSKRYCGMDTFYVGGMGLSGNLAIALSLRQNVKYIFLLGYDFGNVGNNTHWYQDKVKLYNIKSDGVGNKGIYLVKKNKVSPFVNDYIHYKKEAEIKRVKIYNVSLVSRITVFERISYKKFFATLDNIYKTCYK